MKAINVVLTKLDKYIFYFIRWVKNRSSVCQYWGLSSLWSYGSWIYNYLCNQCLSPLTLWVWILLRRGVLNTTLWTPVSSTKKNRLPQINEILLKVVLNTITLTLCQYTFTISFLCPLCWCFLHFFHFDVFVFLPRFLPWDIFIPTVIRTHRFLFSSCRCLFCLGWSFLFGFTFLWGILQLKILYILCRVIN